MGKRHPFVYFSYNRRRKSILLFPLKIVEMQKSTYPKGNVIEGHHDIFEK